MKPSEHDSRRDLGEALRGCAEPMDARAKAEIRGRVLASARTIPARRTSWRVPQRIAAGVAIATALSGGVAYAASDAMPGDFLYPVKRAIENAAVALLPGGEIERQVLVGIAARRADEAAQLHQVGPAELSTEALRELRDALERVSGPRSTLTEDEEARIRESAGEQGDATRDVVDDVIGPSRSEGPGTPQPNGSDSGTGGRQDSDPAGSDSGNGSGGPESDSGPPPDTSGAGARDSTSQGPGPGRN